MDVPQDQTFSASEVAVIIIIMVIMIMMTIAAVGIETINSICSSGDMQLYLESDKGVPPGSRK